MTTRQAPEIFQIPLDDLDPVGLPPRGTAEFEQAVIGLGGFGIVMVFVVLFPFANDLFTALADPLTELDRITALIDLGQRLEGRRGFYR